MIIPILLLATLLSATPADKQAAIASVDRHSAELVRLSDQVWAFAETALLETKSSKLLAAALKPLEEQKPDPPGGSTDVGDISWIVPTLHFSVTTAPLKAPWHAWPVVACGGMSIGHKDMIYAAKTLATTAIDLFQDSTKREAIQAEFREKTRGQIYRPYIPAGPPKVPR